MESKLPILDQIAPNFARFVSDNLQVWFSYQTCIAFRAKGRLVVRKNEWGVTTGKHLNQVDGGDKAARVDEATFQAAYDAAIA